MSPLLSSAVSARARSRRAGRRTTLVGLLCLAFVLVMLPLGLRPTVAEATVRQPFTPAFSTEDNGAITIVGNSQMSCPNAQFSDCIAAKAGSGSNAINNYWQMAFLDADSSSATTNSTSADLAMPAGSIVLYARLVWGGRLTAGAAGRPRWRATTR